MDLALNTGLMIHFELICVYGLRKGFGAPGWLSR